MPPVLLLSNDKKAINKYINSSLCRPDDLFFELAPEGTKYLISQIKEVMRQTFVFNPKRRIYFFPDFHLSTIEAQNAFLKGLEEAPPGVQFILTADSAVKLLPTVISRTKVISLDKNPTIAPIESIQNQLEQMFRKKNLGELNINSFEVKNKEDAVKIIQQILIFFRGLLTKDPKSSAVIKETIYQNSLLENNNLTPQLTVDHVLIFVAKLYNMKI